jgi:hypothetical protein
VLHPPQAGRVRQIDTALRHHGRQIAMAQLETQIPADAQHYDFPVKVPPLEQLLDLYKSCHMFIIPIRRGFAEPVQARTAGAVIQQGIWGWLERRQTIRALRSKRALIMPYK